MFGWEFLLMLSRDSEDEMWSRFMLELLIWLQEVTLARWTQPSGPLCLWQCFLKIPIIHSKKYSFFWKRSYRPGLSTYGDGGGGLPYEPNLESSIRRHPFRKEMKMKWRNSGTTVSRLICCFYFARKSGHTQRKGEGPSWRLTLPTFFEILSFVGPDDIEYIITFYLIVFYCFFLEFQFAMVLS